MAIGGAQLIYYLLLLLHTFHALSPQRHHHHNSIKQSRFPLSVPMYAYIFTTAQRIWLSLLLKLSYEYKFRHGGKLVAF
jgi:hypothetical protein